MLVLFHMSKQTEENGPEKVVGTGVVGIDTETGENWQNLML